MPKSKKNPDLGRALMKAQSQSRHRKGSSNSNHTTELNDGNDWARLNLRSITEQSNLDEFLATAELANTEFIAEKENIKIISSNTIAHLPTAEELSVMKDTQDKFIKFLCIPRRPLWDESTTAEELQEKENESFLTWRRQLVDLQEKEGLLLTPYEKNIQFWRQLWRVVERSDIVVQIVDARNPILFRCDDLENYVKEVKSCKENIFLLNKADHLTSEQRLFWAKYFQENGILAIFFSALTHLEEDSCDKDDDSDSVSGDDEMEKPAENKFNALEAIATGAIFDREQLTNFWLSFPIAEKVKDGVTTVGLVGYPNVGKSSTINSLLQYKKVSVSATPGKTKHFQTLMLSEDLCLCDCPGLVFPSFVSTKAEMIINGILPIDQMLDCFPPVALLTSLIPSHILESTYGILLSEKGGELHTTAEKLLNAYGYMRGFMTQRGLPDVSRSSRYILKDFVNGKLLHCEAPPTMKQSDFHQFPPPKPSGVKPHITPIQRKLLTEGKITSQDIEDKFFKMVSLGFHQKGKNDNASTTIDTDTDKPWRKHNNRNKREKLRKVYAHHDH